VRLEFFWKKTKTNLFFLMKSFLLFVLYIALWTIEPIQGSICSTECFDINSTFVNSMEQLVESFSEPNDIVFLANVTEVEVGSESIEYLLNLEIVYKMTSESIASQWMWYFNTSEYSSILSNGLYVFAGEMNPTNPEPCPCDFIVKESNLTMEMDDYLESVFTGECSNTSFEMATGESSNPCDCISGTYCYCIQSLSVSGTTPGPCMLQVTNCQSAVCVSTMGPSFIIIIVAVSFLTLIMLSAAFGFMFYKWRKNRPQQTGFQNFEDE